jgi:hypothetical protein
MTVEVAVFERDPCSLAAPAASRAGGFAPAAMASPGAPRITLRCLLHQFWVDVFGKEVQTTATYSYTWIADQVGHICLGILISFALSAALFFLPSIWPRVVAFGVGAAAVSAWEVAAYYAAKGAVIGYFPLDTKTLRDNAVIAALYMIMGLGAGCALQQGSRLAIGCGLLGLILLAALLAPPWLRQKIIWQKAALPYLFRLADAQLTIDRATAGAVQKLIDNGAPADPAAARQVIVAGPIGSGRTSIAAGIGTEFAFKKTKVRYLSLDTLLECAAGSSARHFADDTGPATIVYWRWSEAQIVIIDDIGPLIADVQQQAADLAKFREFVHVGLAPIRDALSRCHTVWVIGDVRPDGEAMTAGPALEEFADVVHAFCRAAHAPLAVPLSDPPQRRPKPRSDTAMVGQWIRAKLRRR